MVGKGGPAENHGDSDCAGDGFEEDVEAAVENGADSAEIEREIRNGEPRREGNESWTVGSLRVVSMYGSDTLNTSLHVTYKKKGDCEDCRHTYHVYGHIDWVVVVCAILLSPVSIEEGGRGGCG